MGGRLREEICGQRRVRAWGGRPDADPDAKQGKKVDRGQDGREEGRSLGGGVKAQKGKEAEWVIRKMEDAMLTSAGLGRSWRGGQGLGHLVWEETEGGSRNEECERLMEKEEETESGLEGAV